MHASETIGGGQLILSLAGGRKTMSTDIQQAGHIFGCHAMLHILASAALPADDKLLFNRPLEKKYVENLMPVTVSAGRSRDAVLDVNPVVYAGRYELNRNRIENYIRPDLTLYQEITGRLSKAGHLLMNYSLNLIGTSKQSNFHALYALPPKVVNNLNKRRIGLDAAKADAEIRFLQRLPKAELHCHLGGILDADEMIAVAETLENPVKTYLNKYSSFAGWLDEVKKRIENGEWEKLRSTIVVKDLRKKLFPEIPEPFTVAAFLQAFSGKSEVLDRFIFGPMIDTEQYVAIGIKQYEALGDLQGSALLQSEPAIRKACEFLIKKCREHNVKYLELRISPVNYTRGGLAARRVVDIINEELSAATYTHFSLIVIGSRHGRLQEIRRHVALALEILQDDAISMLRGFDLAGDEHVRAPSELRDEFMPLMEKSVNLTIHAGENESVKNIWEAVYHLSADRIGHGLTLNDDPRLKKRFLDRKITIEMCPSSNDQIVGYSAGEKRYPLKEYLLQGLRVTVNTDNPGISRTDFSYEYYKAARLTENGLTIWEILQLIRNGFRGAFLPFEERQALLVQAEKEILNMIEEEDFV